MERTKGQKKDEVADFINLCNAYCQILDKADKLPLHEFLDKVSDSLMAVYQKTFAITRFKTRYESEPQKFLSEKLYNKVRLSVMNILDKRDGYMEILDPNHIGNQNIFQASLSEDLTDIYQDFYDFVQWYSVGTFESINDSLIECLSNFEKYWGVKLLNALRAIHVIRYLKKDGSIFADPLSDEEEDIINNDEKDDEDEMDSEALGEFLKEDL
ncbi:MAG TPA: DUF5063 domain-containing protein [Bacteroidales bacterium]